MRNYSNFGAEEITALSSGVGGLLGGTISGAFTSSAMKKSVRSNERLAKRAQDMQLLAALKTGKTAGGTNIMVWLGVAVVVIILVVVMLKKK